MDAKQAALWVAPITGAVLSLVVVQSSGASTEQRQSDYTTAYSYFDNTPPGSAEISNPVLHKRAGGKGTYADPVTVAVGHSITGRKDTLDYPQGTRFYIPNLRKYFIVEDTCGDGKTPQNGPCHRLNTPGDKAPKGAKAWIDVWVGGKGSTRTQANKCMDRLTGVHAVIRNPAKTYRVVSGDILSNGSCRTGYGNGAVK